MGKIVRTLLQIQEEFFFGFIIIAVYSWQMGKETTNQDVFLLVITPNFRRSRFVRFFKK